MASVTNKEIPEEFGFWGEVFVYRKKYYAPESEEDYWNGVIEGGNQILEKYQGHEHYGLFQKIVWDLIDHWEKQMRLEKEKEDNIA